MPGPILFLQMQSGKKEPVVTVPMLSSYEAKTQIDAMEAQAVAMDKMLVLTAQLEDWPKTEDEPEEEKPDA